jgi:hypothetical protein
MGGTGDRHHVFLFFRNQSDGHSCGSGLESKALRRAIGDQLARPASLCWNQPADSAVFTEGGGTGIVSVFRPISRSSRLFQGGVKPPHSKAFGTARPSGVKETWLLRSLVPPFQGLGEPVTRGRDAGYPGTPRPDPYGASLAPTALNSDGQRRSAGWARDAERAGRATSEPRADPSDPGGGGGVGGVAAVACYFLPPRCAAVSGEVTPHPTSSLGHLLSLEKVLKMPRRCGVLFPAPSLVGAH